MHPRDRSRAILYSYVNTVFEKVWQFEQFAVTGNHLFILETKSVIYGYHRKPLINQCSGPLLHLLVVTLSAKKSSAKSHKHRGLIGPGLFRLIDIKTQE
jgi:hypothetical protein